MANIEAKPDREFIPIEDGKHEGIIVDAQINKHGKYDYLDLQITCDQMTREDTGEEITLKASYPPYISPSSKLGQLIKRLGIDIETGQEFDTDELKTITVSYQTMQVGGKGENSDKVYANILPETVKKLKQ